MILTSSHVRTQSATRRLMPRLLQTKNRLVCMDRCWAAKGKNQEEASHSYLHWNRFFLEMPNLSQMWKLMLLSGKVTQIVHYHTVRLASTDHCRTLLPTESQYHLYKHQKQKHIQDCFFLYVNKLMDATYLWKHKESKVCNWSWMSEWDYRNSDAAPPDSTANSSCCSWNLWWWL